MEEFEEKKNAFLEKLNNDDPIIVELETQDQSRNLKWFEYRRNKLTASNFGRICKRRRNTKTDSILKTLLYKNQFLTTHAM